MHRKTESSIHLKDYKPSAYLIDKTELQFDLDEADTLVKSTLNIRKNPDVKENNNTLVLDGEHITPTRVAINGKVLPASQYKITDSHLIINDVPRAFKLQIENHLKPKENDTLNGLYVTNGVLCTLCEAESFRRLTYFLDRPDILSTYKTKLIADKKKYPYLLSNGILTSKGNYKTGKHWVTWSDSIPKPSYLFVMVAGQFDIAEDSYTTKSGREIKIQIYVEKGKADQCGLAIDVLKKAMRWDEETYGREYDLNTYKIVAVDDFNASADENTGINIFKTDCLLGTPANSEEHQLSWIQSTVPHEFFHHWSGNRVTIRDWFQVSLKEGLTTFREQSFNEDLLTRASRLESVKSLREYQFKQDGYPVQPTSIDTFEDFQQNATSSIYNKGAEIFRMFETLLGKELFRKGMKLYFDRFKGKSATFENYVKTLEEVSEKDLSQFLLWFRQSGTPELRITDEYNAKTKTYTLKFDQTNMTMAASSAEGLNITEQNLKETKPLPIPIRLALFDKKGVAIPLCMTGAKTEKEKVLLLTENKGEFKFKNVRSKPVPSILRGFSAPVLISHERSQEDLEVLLRHDEDVFTRFEAGKVYIVRTLLEMIQAGVEGEAYETPPKFIETMRILLKSKTLDPLVLSKLLAFPSEMSITQSLEKVNLDAIHEAREALQNEMAKALTAEFEAVLARNATHDKTDLATDPGLRHSLGKRQLQNACRYYLIREDKGSIHKKLMDRFNETLNINLSDNLAALQLLVDQGGEEAEKALSVFYEKWKENPEKMQHWIEVQVLSQSPDYFNMIRKLLNHPAFDITNDYQAAALFYGFFANLPKCYGSTEESYEFIAELYHRLIEAESALANELVIIVATWCKCFDETRLEYVEKHIHPILKKKEEVEESEEIEAPKAAMEFEEEAEEVEASEQDEEEAEEEATEEEEEVEEAEKCREESRTSRKDDAEFGNKTNRQIHLLLKKQGLFGNHADLEKSSQHSCESSREDYRQFARKLLGK